MTDERAQPTGNSDAALSSSKGAPDSPAVVPAESPPPRILALDFGSKRIGMAVSDPLGITAQGLETLERKNKRTDFEALERVIREHQVSEIVLGNPLRLSGQAGTQAEKVQQFAEELRRKFGLPIHLWDERLTSSEANRLLRDSEVSTRGRPGIVDRMAATLILQAFMEHRKVAG